jgi:hypothetical protein
MQEEHDGKVTVRSLVPLERRIFDVLWKINEGQADTKEN